MQPKTIDSVPCEVLILMLDNLRSLDKVRSLSICKRWLEIFDANQVLWRRLDLPQKTEGWPPYVLDLFDRRSSSSLEEINMDISFLPEAVELFLETLGKQRVTLRVLHLRAFRFEDETVLKILSDLDSLLDCRFSMVLDESPASKVRLLTDGIDREDESTRNKGGLKLKILWNPSLKAIKLNAHHLCNLVSFRSDLRLLMETFWTLFRQCSQTLKHLSIKTLDEPEKSFQDLEFPQLQVFEIACRSARLPTWMKIPFSVTLVSHFQAPSLPSVSRIWLRDLNFPFYGLTALDVLAFRCPEVAEILVENPPEGGKNCDLTSKDCRRYVAMLRQRRENVAAGLVVDGIKMINLKRLVVPFAHLTDKDISNLRELVEEVVDLNTVQRFIEVQI